MCAETRFDELLALPFVEPTEILRYGEHSDQYGLLWSRPADAISSAPLVILIHGGCWLHAYNVEHIRPLASHLLAEGFDVWAPEYRRVLGAGGYPETFDDIAKSVQFILQRRHNETPWALIGHSAGGHLALWAASEPSLPTPHLTIGLAAITDLNTYGSATGSCPKSVALLLGGNLDEKAFLYESLSPINRIFDAPLVIMQGLADPIVSTDQAEAMSSATRDYLENVDHFDFINPQRDVVDKLVRHLKKGLEE